MSDRPKGSGYFAVISGGLFALAFLGTFIVNLASISPDWIMRAWLLVVAAILVYWGVKRIVPAQDDSFRVGQDTINFVIGLFGATLALLGILKH